VSLYAPVASARSMTLSNEMGNELVEEVSMRSGKDFARFTARPVYPAPLEILSNRIHVPWQVSCPDIELLMPIFLNKLESFMFSFLLTVQLPTAICSAPGDRVGRLFVL
jgi:hypothetical protein